MQTNFIIKNKNPRIKSLGVNIMSHHSLGAFFSSQDIKMLAQEGNDTNCFVSLVVDTKGTYVAAITRKIQNTSEVTVKNLGISYEFFGEGTVNLESSKEEKHKIVDNVSIEYFNLEVERHQVPNTLAYLDTRFEEINRKKAQNNKTTTSFSLFDTPFKSEISNIKNQCLFADDVMESLKSSNISNIKKEEEEDIDWAPDPKYIDKAIVNIITCSLLINPKKFKLEEWITKYMSSAYRNIFGNKELSEDEIITGQPFTEWVDFIIGWTLDHFPIDEEAEINYGVDYCTRVIAEILYLKLSEYSTISPYVNVYCETLAFYLET